MDNIVCSIKMFLVLTILTGVLYPVLITVTGQLIFNKQANGSLVIVDKNAVGSVLIGQNWSSPKYFHGRPSVCNYDTISSGATNKSVTSKELNNFVNANYAALSKEYNTKEVPQEMITSSGSGLDPHISKKAALLQVNRIAIERKMNLEEKNKLRETIRRLAESGDFGIFGEDRVNVLRLNLALDSK